MKNEKKAKEIYKDNLYECEVRGIAQDKKEILFMLEKMAQWKDEQHAKEKQQWIDKAAEWLRMTMDFFNNGEFNTEKFVNDFKKEMKEEY